MAFVHDHIFRMHNDSEYYEGESDYLILQRYLYAFSSLTVIGRCVNVDFESAGKLSQASGKGVGFFFLRGKSWVSAFSWFLVPNILIIRSPIKKADIVLLRLPSFISLVVYPITVLLRKRVGRRPIVAAGSVVTKDVPPCSLVGGVLAKIIKKIEQ
jgi:hypothetical protein